MASWPSRDGGKPLSYAEEAQRRCGRRTRGALKHLFGCRMRRTDREAGAGAQEGLRTKSNAAAERKGEDAGLWMLTERLASGLLVTQGYISCEIKVGG